MTAPRVTRAELVARGLIRPGSPHSDQGLVDAPTLRLDDEGRRQAAERIARGLWDTGRDYDSVRALVLGPIGDEEMP